MRKNTNSSSEAVKIKLKQLYLLFIHLVNLIVNYLYTIFGPMTRVSLRFKPDNNFSFCYLSVHKTLIDDYINSTFWDVKVWNIPTFLSEYHITYVHLSTLF